MLGDRRENVSLSAEEAEKMQKVTEWGLGGVDLEGPKGKHDHAGED